MPRFLIKRQGVFVGDGACRHFVCGASETGELYDMAYIDMSSTTGDS